jgi:hypothetical protein
MFMNELRTLGSGQCTICDNMEMHTSIGFV